MKLKLVKKQPVAENIVSFWFEPEISSRYIAGQYTELYLPHPSPDSRKTKRWFTLSSSPTEKLWAITTKFNTQKSSTFKKALKDLELNTEISAHMPMGDFVLPKDSSLTLIFVAVGMGITPYRSILKYLQDSNQKRDIKLIYALKDEREIAFAELIEKNTTEFKKHIGRLSAEDILNFAGNLENKLIYLSGPELLVVLLESRLKESGVPANQIRTDAFLNYNY